MWVREGSKPQAETMSEACPLQFTTTSKVSVRLPASPVGDNTGVDSASVLQRQTDSEEVSVSAASHTLLIVLFSTAQARNVPPVVFLLLLRFLALLFVLRCRR